MVEAIVPRDRNGLVVRLVFLLALLGVGAGVFFKATSTEAAANDFTIAIADSVDPVAAGSPVTYTVTIGDGADPLVAPGFLSVYLVFDQNDVANRAQIGVDYTIGNPTNADWTCAIQFAIQNLWGCTSTIAHAPAGPIPLITIPVSTLPTARDGYVIRIRGTVDSTATVGAGNNPDSPEVTQDTTIDTVADLSIDKADVPGTYIAGDLVPFNITVANLGPSAAPANIRVTDTVPGGLVLDSVAQPFNAGGGFMCSTPAAATASGTVISCTRTSALLQGTSVVLTIPFRVGATTPAGTITNTASVCVPTNFCFGTAGDVDPNAANDVSSGDVTVGASFDLGITKTASSPTVTAGSSFSYTINTTGAGATAGQPGVINDVMTGPAGGTYTVVGANGWTCSPVGLQPFTGNAAITCNNATVPVGASNPAATVTVNVPANTPGGTYSNTAGISGANPDPDQANNSAGPVLVNVLVQADIQITKCAVATTDVSGTCAAAIPQVQVGDDFLYRIIVSNAGPSAAPANTVSVGDSLPSQIAFRGNPLFGPAANQTPLVAGWLCAPAPVVTGLGGQSVTCTNQTDVIDALSTVVINLPVEATPQAPAGQLQCNFASATVSSPPITDPDLSNNTNPAPGACVLVTTISDLGVTKVGTPDEVVPGGSITYSIVVSNGGPSPALNPILTDVVPVGTFLQALSAPAGWTCRKNSSVGVVITPANAPGFTGTIYCAGPASMAVGASANFIVTVQTDILQVSGATTVSNTAIVNLPGGVNVEALCPNAVAGDPEDAPADATCGLLPDSATATTEVLEYDILVEKTATVFNDPVLIDPLYIPGGVFAGEQIGYDITITNLGPDDAPANVISLGDGRDNPLKLQGTVDLSLAPQFTCTVGPDNPPQFNKSITCVNTQGGLPAAGNPPVISYIAQVTPSTPAGTLVCNSATAHVTPPGADTTTLNNESEVCNTVVTSSDLSVQKVAPQEVSPGTLLTYSIVVNNAGPGIALNPVLYDTVPADTTFQAMTAPLGWTCVRDANNLPLQIGLPAGTVIRCQAPSMAVGSALFTLSVMVSATPVGATIDNNDDVTINNVLFGTGACVIAGPDNFVDVNGTPGEINIDLNLANNCAQASTAIIQLAHLNVLKTVLNPLYAGQGQVMNNPPYNAPALYRVEVTNTGPNPAMNVVFHDLLPGGVTAFPVAPILEYISGTTSTVTNQATLSAVCATYNGLAGTETCALGNLAVGQTLKFNVRVMLDQSLAAFPDTDCYGAPANELGTQVCNRARFTSTSLEASLNVIPRPTIDTFDDDKQTVTTKSDLSITKVAETLAGAPIGTSCSGTGCEFNYVITVDNLGPSDTPTLVQFTDIFPSVPAGALKITGTTIPAGWTCDQFPLAGTLNVVDIGTLSPVTIVCTSAGPITAAAAAEEFIFQVEAQAAAVTGTVLVNNTCFWQNGTPLPPIDDPVLGNNCAANTLTINNGNTINGIKYIDQDGDGNPADVETNTGAGFEIFIDDGRGGGTAGDAIKNGTEPSAITGANGAYSISGLIGVGPWRVCESDRAGYTQTGVTGTVVFVPVGGTAVADAPGPNACWTITFPAGAEPNKVANEVNFLNFQHFTISGFKYEDVDGDGTGVIEPNESGVDTPNFTLYVDYNDNGVMDPGEPSSTQLPGNPIGDYRISNVGPCQQTANICQVREVRTAGWVQTFPNSGVANLPITDANGVPLYPYDPDVNNPLNPVNSSANSVGVPVVAGANVPNINFGNFKLIVVSGLKFNDLDADGAPREAGEPALAGFHTCWDFDNSGECNAPEPEYTTAADGTYSYLVGPGTSFVFCEDLLTSPSGWTATYPTTNSLGNCHDPILADSGDVITDVTFGNFQNILRGFKWNDKALFPVLPDGAHDPDGVDNTYGNADDETGLGGWLICAIPVTDPGQTPDCNASRQYKDTTDAQGNWEIIDLPSGVTYRICEEPKVGWNQVYPANSCHFLTIPSTSGPLPSDHIFGAFIPGTNSIPALVSPVAPVPGTPLNFGNNSPLPDVDMSLTKSAPSSVVVGANLDFNFQVRNNSAFPATNVVFTDVVDTNLISGYVGTVSPTPGAWSCVFVSPNLTCTRTGQQPANTTETVRVRFLASLTPGGPYFNSACVTADNPDPVSANNCGTTSPTGTVVNAAPVPVNTADLKIDKSASPITAPQQLGPNKIITYKIRVRNLGPQAASNVLVTDVLKSGLLFNAWVNKASYTCNSPAVNATGTVNCGKASVPNLGVNTIEFKVKTPNPVPLDGAGPNDAKVEQCTSLVLTGSAITSFAGCSTSLNDSNPANNTTTAVASLP